MNLQEFVTRKDNIIAAALQAGRQRAMSTAHELSRGGSMAAAAELVNEAVTKLIELAYQVDDCGLCNVDPDTGAFERFPIPWGRSYMRYGLRATEAAILRLHVNLLLSTGTPPLWTYDSITRRWGVNLFDYPTRDAALAYWKRAEVSGRDYKMMLQTVQSWRKSDTIR